MLADSPITPLSIGASNCVSMTGLSWAFVLRFARAHAVPIYRVAARKQLVDGPALLAALARVSAQASQTPITDARERELMRAQLGMELTQ